MASPDSPAEPLGAGPGDGLGGCLVGLLILIGIVLLLPGLCSLVVMIPFLIGRGSAGDLAMFWLLWLMTFVVAAGGILLMRYAWRNR